MNERRNDWGLLMLRLGLGGVFLWFGIDKFINPVTWSRWIPDWALSLIPIGDMNMIYMIGAVEAFIGLLLILGWMTKAAAVMAGLLIMMVIPAVGYNDIMIRDMGLMFMAVSIMMLGPGEKSIDSWLVWRRKIKEAKRSYK